MTAHLVLKVGGGEQVVVLGPVNSLGRHPSNSIQILDKIASKEHCLIERREDRYVLRDLGSLNGTFINSVRVRGEAPLVDGDEISIGSTRGIFHCGAPAPDDAPASVRSSAPGSMRPAFPDERILAYLATDKPVHRPGEMLYARAALLDAFTRAPAQRSGNLGFEVRSPSGDVVVSRPAPVARGIGAFSWAIPDDLPAGDYTLFARCPAESFPPAEIAVAIRAFRAPLLRLALEVARQAYGPGDEVVAALSVSRADGGIPIGASATVVATVDGGEIDRRDLPLDDEGAATWSFRLPADIVEGEGVVTVTVRDAGVTESRARPIPIALHRVRVAFYPEGGDLVVGLPGRLYVEARTPKGKPTSVHGRVLDSTGEIVARFHTEHEGRGVATLTPTRSGRAYIALLDEPAGVAEIFPLPEVKREGFALTALDDVTGVEQPVRLRVAASAAGKVRVTLSVRELEVAALRIDLAAGEAREIAMTPPGSADGVLRATLFDAAGVPRAERLVFRRPARSLRVTVEMRPAGPAPPRAGGPPRAGLRSPITLRVKTTDAEGTPCASTVTLSVIDDALLEAIPPRERPATLPEQVLLGGEVLTLGDPAAYLGPEEGAARRLDLLLGTQGFRRFAFHEVARFAADHGDRAERVLARRRAPFPDFVETVMRSPTSALSPRIISPRTAPTGPRTPPPRLAPPLLPPGWKPERGRMIVPRPALPLVVVREYAHRAAAPGARDDLSETIYWHAGVATSAGGEAQIAFDLGDAVTTFRARADAFSDRGALGHGQALLEASRPFVVEPELPSEVTAGDLVEVPIAVTNGSATPADVNVSLAVTGGLLAGREPVPLSIGEGRRESVHIPLAVMRGRGEFAVTVRASAGLRGDEVTLPLAVAPAGFPLDLEASGRLDPEIAAVHLIPIPASTEPGSIATEVVLHPTLLAMLAHADEALLRGPASSFEQALARAVPSVLTLEHLALHRRGEPRLFKRSAEHLAQSCARLAAFACPAGGYAMFGGAAASEALTAHAVMALAAIARVFPIDPATLDRARTWLLARRDGRGGFLHDATAEGGASAAPKPIGDAYITWALGRAGVEDLSPEIASVEELALAGDDAYHLALAAGAILQRHGAGAAALPLARLAEKQDRDGAVRGAATSITRSSGANLIVETTSLATLAWLSAGESGRAALAVRWLYDHGKGGGFGATQATVLALQAIAAFEATRPRPNPTGAVEVMVDGETCVTAELKAEASGVVALPSFASALGPGERRITLRLRGGAPMSYALRVRVATPEPTSALTGRVAITTSLDRVEMTEGEAVELRAVVANLSGDGLPLVTAILGLPAGLAARPDDLDELTVQRKIDAWELQGRTIVIYVRALRAGERRVIPVVLLAAIPGSYTGPASCAYLAYTDDEKRWTAPLRARIFAAR